MNSKTIYSEINMHHLQLGRDEISLNSTLYNLECESNEIFNLIYDLGRRNTHPQLLEYYRSINLEIEYRDNQRPRAPVVPIAGQRSSKMALEGKTE